MPRVSEQYREQRRGEIVAAAARLFAVNGFHATSMADVIAECGLSAGAVYRYFAGKDDLILAVSEAALTAADEAFQALLADGAAPSPRHALTFLIRVIDERVVHNTDTGVDVSRIGVQVWAEALRNPRMAARADEVYQRLRGYFAEVARRRQAAGKLPADVVPEQIGAAMLSLVQGYILQRLLISDTDTEDYLAGVTALLTDR
ncbi:TetR/AcrR family transcriptional regulator [Actinoplanes xinjiangensis]|jgi:AcrR family transcriptional regulator|uniref:TetR family transcriptional regulator n=1 Tax=Actinoplanes xinjiangensis TaxID=512350 RepID=A0A316EFL9_9ACTN|nr:TetR/AcrR family transcriptional regulator [Actinoplanes xinjiangensis]PWK30148.1 TetR family transcriptional regulator [Actinoplanes xinjiangensis]GIF44575.1 TetR family transcriptional regulator [Actinoplanes xinjiangensis]